MRTWRAPLIRRRTEFLGHVQAPDHEAAEAEAAERFNLTEEQRRRLVLQGQLSRYLGGWHFRKVPVAVT